MAHGGNERSYKSVRKQITEAAHFFQMLGVHRGSTTTAINNARRELAKYVHPDVNSAADAGDLMAQVNTARDTLIEGRERYIAELRLKPCTTCKAKGFTAKQKGFTKVVETACPDCRGAGVK